MMIASAEKTTSSPFRFITFLSTKSVIVARNLDKRKGERMLFKSKCVLIAGNSYLEEQVMTEKAS